MDTKGKKYNEKQLTDFITNASNALECIKNFDDLVLDCLRHLSLYLETNHTLLASYNRFTQTFLVELEYLSSPTIGETVVTERKGTSEIRVSDEIYDVLLQNQLYHKESTSHAIDLYDTQENPQEFTPTNQIIVPLQLESRLWGLILSANDSDQRAWSDKELAYCQQMASLLENLLNNEPVIKKAVADTSVLNAIIDHVPISVFWKDQNLRYLNANRTFRDFYMLEDDSFLHKTTQHHMPPEYANEVEEIERYILAENPDPQSLISIVENHWGSVRWVRTTRVPITNNFDEVVSIVGISEDITNEVEYEEKAAQHTEQLNRALQQAEQANAAKTEFLSRMSHEIRTPLNAIIGLSQIGIDSDNFSFIKETLHKIHSASENLYDVINDLLDMSKIEANKMSIVNKEFDLEEMLIATYNVITTSAQEKNLNLVVELDHALPQKMVGDRNHLTQVLVNLLSNAVKFTDSGGFITLRIGVVEKEKNSITIEFQVEDTGIGLEPEFAETLFDPFEQAELSPNRSQKGTGLGLAISAKLTELMGGTISVTSAVGIGSTFYVTLPFEISNDFVSILDDSALSLTGKKILVLGNHTTKFSYTYDNYLLALGAKVFNYLPTDTPSLLQHLSEHPADLVVSDLSFSDPNTLPIIHTAVEVFGPEKILLMTSGQDSLQYHAIAKELGLSHAVQRPLFPKSFLNVIRKALHLPLEPPADKKTAPDFSGMKLMVVEDISINREIIEYFLKDTGISIYEAINGKEAVDLYVEHDGAFHLIFMDVQMPIMSGYDATRAIRSLEKVTGQHVPIYAMTASAYGSDIQRSLTVGMDAHIAKPFKKEEIFDTVARHRPSDSSLKNTKKSFPELSSVDTKYIDWREGMSRVIGEKDFYLQLLDNFVDTSQKLVLQAKEAWKNNDNDSLLFALHSLKGSSQILALSSLAETIAQLEESAFLSTLTPEEISNFRKTYDHTIAAIQLTLDTQDTERR